MVCAVEAAPPVLHVPTALSTVMANVEELLLKTSVESVADMVPRVRRTFAPMVPSTVTASVTAVPCTIHAMCAMGMARVAFARMAKLIALVTVMDLQLKIRVTSATAMVHRAVRTTSVRTALLIAKENAMETFMWTAATFVVEMGHHVAAIVKLIAMAIATAALLWIHVTFATGLGPRVSMVRSVLTALWTVTASVMDRKSKTHAECVAELATAATNTKSTTLITCRAIVVTRTVKAFATVQWWTILVRFAVATEPLALKMVFALTAPLTVMVNVMAPLFMMSAGSVEALVSLAVALTLIAKATVEALQHMIAAMFAVV